MVANRSVGTGLVASAVVSVCIYNSFIICHSINTHMLAVMVMEHSLAKLRAGNVSIRDFRRVLVWSGMYTVC
jgi:high-affinity K+ transport system ATPase subunit B